MPRDQVYQLRLTSEEKSKLASVAKDRDSSIAQMIRKDYGLDEASTTYAGMAVETDTSMPEGEIRIVASEPSHSASEIKRLAMERHAHLPLTFAERKVREELR